MLNAFLTERYDDIVKMTEKITQDSNFREIAHYAIEQFMVHHRAEELIDKGQAMSFLSGIIYRNYHSSTSPYHKLFRQSGRVYANDTLFRIQSQFNEDSSLDVSERPYSIAKGHKTQKQKVWERLEAEDYDFDTDFKLDAIEGILEDMMADDQHIWYIASLFVMWIETPNYSEIERKTRIPRTSISQAVKECIEYIKQKIQDDGLFN